MVCLVSLHCDALEFLQLTEEVFDQVAPLIDVLSRNQQALIHGFSYDDEIVGFARVHADILTEHLKISRQLFLRIVRPSATQLGTGSDIGQLRCSTGSTPG